MFIFDHLDIVPSLISYLAILAAAIWIIITCPFKQKNEKYLVIFFILLPGFVTTFSLWNNNISFAVIGLIATLYAFATILYKELLKDYKKIRLLNKKLYAIKKIYETDGNCINGNCIKCNCEAKDLLLKNIDDILLKTYISEK